jgi:polyhydroxyalkanoate synthesis regulator phasin
MISEQGVIMLDLIKKTMMTGLGLALLAKDEVEDLAKEVVEKGKMTEKEGRKFFDDLQKRYDEVQSKLEDRVEKTVKELFKKADVVTGDELKALKKEIRELKKAISNKSDASG